MNNMFTLYNFFLFLTGAVIISQTIHVYFVFDSFSKLSGWLRTFQAVMFCSIISLSILAFVLAGKSNLALLGALVEVIVNCYYYAMDFFENGIKKGSRTQDDKQAKESRNNSILTFWRKNWIGIFFGILIPMLIFIFAKEMEELR